jgi:Protein of unknown function (DUF935)
MVATSNGVTLYDHCGRPIARQPYGPDAVPHVLTFGSLFGTSWKTYLHDRWDEALRESRESALVMRRDAFLMGLLQERKLATASLKWHLEVPDEQRPEQKLVKDHLTKVLLATPRLQRFLMSLLEALWYGRYGVQVEYEWATVSGLRSLVVKHHTPVNGDKIGHAWDGTPYLLVSAAHSNELAGRGAQFLPNKDARQCPRADLIHSSIARAMLLNGSWRQRFVLHSHEVDDADYFDAERAEAVHGVGIRHRVYWIDYLKRELLSTLQDHLERIGLGVTLWPYDASNPTAKQETFEAAAQQTRNSVILLPTWRDQGSGEPYSMPRRLEIPTSGAELVGKLTDYFDKILERFIVGQSMSGGADIDDGLGGTGRAQFAADTKKRIVSFDAANLADTLTEDLVDVVRRFTFPAADFPVRWVFDVDVEDPKDTLEAVSTAYEMGVDFKRNEVRALTGLSDPQPGDDVVGGRQERLENVMLGLTPDGKRPPPPPPGAGPPNGNSEANGAAGPEREEEEVPADAGPEQRGG